jgi:hypothetical protein
LTASLVRSKLPDVSKGGPTSENPLAASGRVLTVEWARDSRGRLPALAVFREELDEQQRIKLRERFQRLADFGKIENREQFKQLGAKAKGDGRFIWEFKIFRVRFLGDFRALPSGRRRFVVAHGVANKKTDKLSPSDIEKAVRIMKEHDELEAKTRKPK